MNFINTKKLENSKGQGQGQGSKVNKANVAQNATKSNLDKRFEVLGKIDKSFANNKKQIISIAIDAKTMESLDKYCKKHCAARSAIINRLLLDWLDNKKD